MCCRYDVAPLNITIGEAKAIYSLDNGLFDMCVGEKRRLVSPANMAYGSQGRGRFKPVYFMDDISAYC